MIDTTKQPDKTIVITGANAGLGYETARRIALSHGRSRIIIAGRDPGRIKQAAQRLKKETGGAVFTPLLLDLASLTSVRAFANGLKDAGFPPISCLILNAGVRHTKITSATLDGYDSTFQINYLGHFLLANLLLEQMDEGARIIALSSRTHDSRDKSPFPKAVWSLPAELARPTPPAGVSESAYTARAYSNSKLCLTMFAFELERRLKEAGSGICVNVFDPGAMATQVNRDFKPALSKLMRFFWPAIRLLPNMSTTRDSAAVLCELAVFEKYRGVSGKYFSMLGAYRKGAKEKSPSPLVFDREKTYLLWEGSAKLTRMD